MIKVIFLAANPLDSTRLRVDEEFREIDQILQSSQYRDEFELISYGAVRISDLQGYLLRNRPNIVHFSAHGSTSGEIFLEDSSGNSQAVPSESLSKLFDVLKDNIRCVVLNACYSEEQSQAIAQHIDFVVGMSREIGDQAAIDFAKSFYQAIGYGRDLKTAFDLGCIQIGLENLKEENTPKFIALHSDPKEMILVGAKTMAQEMSSEEETRDILSYQVVFDRAAFQFPCIFENGLHDLEIALDDTLAAIATGALYSRRKNLLAQVTPKSAFRSEFIRASLGRVTDHLSELRPMIIRLRELLKSLGQQYLNGSTYGYEMEFFIPALIQARVPKDTIRYALEMMDEIDSKRNEAIKEMNLIFSSIHGALLPLIPLSTERIINSVKPEMLYDWKNYYVRSHEVIRPILLPDEKRKHRKTLN